jgi:hypothetical protein
MVTNRIADLLQIRNRFMRSAHLERDFADPEALSGYVVTPNAQSALQRIASGLAVRSGQRAWRVTGDYGTGKSSFALALAHLLRGEEALPLPLRKAVDFRAIRVGRPSLVPILITGSRAPIAPSLVRSLAQAIDAVCPRGRKPHILERLGSVSDTEDAAVNLVLEAAQFVKEREKGSGILIVLDELGKFLEFAAHHPEQQDIYFLQRLAEAAARSGDTPVTVVGLLHQGFQAYAERLSQPAQKEWEKVAGRFEEILFNTALEHMTGLVADALGVRTQRLPRGAAEVLRRDMAWACESGWFGPLAPEGLPDCAPSLFPLHPTVIPVLVRFFSRFGQNERSLFSFLLSEEPHGLQSFAQQPLSGERFYRIHHLYDYARTAFGHRLTVQSYRSHWNQIESVVESYPREDEHELAVLKTVAVLNLLDAPDLVATEDAVIVAVGRGAEKTNRVKTTLKDLHRRKSVLYFRGTAGGYCLWPHTCVNLERAYQDALRAVQTPDRASSLVLQYLDTRPLVARRHYIRTGNLRHFEVSYASADGLQEALAEANRVADGRILVALCDTESERAEALKFARSEMLRNRDDVLFAVPQAFNALASLVAELQRWEWVARNVPELAHDNFAQEEVTRQLTASRQVLLKRIQGYVGLRQFGETVGLNWFYGGREVALANGRALLERLSDLCDSVYQAAPHIHNELVNRHTLSTAAVAARGRLIERVLRHAGEPLLGMDPASKPPEMSMYLSVLQAAKLHRETDGVWVIAEPSDDDPCRVGPVLRRIEALLEEQHGNRLRVIDLFETLRAAPYGVRNGIAPLLLAVFAVIREQDVAFYEQGAFLRQVGGQEFQRLIKAPETFEIQYCKIAGVRAIVFEKLLQALTPDRDRSRKADLLDVVRPLCVFAAQLPQFSQRTAGLSPDALAVRDALLRAEEPATLIFQTLPEACGIAPFGEDQTPSGGRVRRFVDKFRTALDDLRGAYLALLESIKAELRFCFDLPGDFGSMRRSLAASAETVSLSLSPLVPRLKAFCLRLRDLALGEQEWIESIASFVCSKPPARWTDADLLGFRDEVGRLVRQFQRVESTVHAALAGGDCAQAMRVALSCQDGVEVERVIYLNAEEEEKVGALEATVAHILQTEGRLGLLAAARAIFRSLNERGADIQ